MPSLKNKLVSDPAAANGHGLGVGVGQVGRSADMAPVGARRRGVVLPWWDVGLCEALRSLPHSWCGVSRLFSCMVDQRYAT